MIVMTVVINMTVALFIGQEVNNFFTSLTDYFTPLEPPVLAPQEVPPEFLVSEREAFQDPVT